ncbi:uncharacterized protein IAS62_006501 [Cryptococcus decagattii]|uniref:Uncharacterized protein n=1 Tax=Cryptococcus decagattii TaxID=1859122 RepID=A0ABZ2B2V0_9TREE
MRNNCTIYQSTTSHFIEDAKNYSTSTYISAAVPPIWIIGASERTRIVAEQSDEEFASVSSNSSHRPFTFL